MPKLLILIVGKPGSGKSTAADFIKKHFGASVIHSGDVVRGEIKRIGLRYTPENDRKIAHWFHERGREGLIIKRTWKKVDKSKKIVVIEGLRNKRQLNYLRKFTRLKPVVISIEAPFKVREKRELKRERFGKVETFSYLKSREKVEKGHGLWNLIKVADYRVNNSKLPQKQMKEKIVRLVKSLLSS